jgi:hypothetical protein
MLSHFCSVDEISRFTSLSPSACKMYRLKGLWVEGIHWFRLHHNSVLYNKTLIEDWIVNRSNPIAHQRAIDAYLASLPSTVTTESKKTTKRGKVA